MKKLLTLLLALCSMNAMAQLNGAIDLLPAGSPDIKIYTGVVSGGTGRPNNFTYTMPSGDSTGLFVIFQSENNGNGADYPTAVTYGNVPMLNSANSVISTNNVTTQFFNIYIYFLNDSAVATASDNVFRVTYANNSPKNGAGYSFLVFSADEVKQSMPLNFCVAQQTGGNLVTNDSIACGSTVTYNTGDLFMSVGGSSTTNAGPLRSNFPDTLINRAIGSMWQAVFFKQITSTTTLSPYMKTNGTNGMRFMVFGTQILSVVPPPVTPLDVKLTKFEAFNTKSANTISWITATETNLKNFEVQISQDGKDFSTIGYVVPNTGGNTSVPQSYSFNDKASETKVYYRLKMVDMDGTFEYSQIVAVNGTSRTTSSNIYPNPSTGTFTVGVTTADYKLHVINAFGQEVGYTVVAEATQPRALTIKLDNPVTGFYYVVAESEGAASTSKVFIK